MTPGLFSGTNCGKSLSYSPCEAPTALALAAMILMTEAMSATSTAPSKFTSALLSSALNSMLLNPSNTGAAVMPTDIYSIISSNFKFHVQAYTSFSEWDTKISASCFLLHGSEASSNAHLLHKMENSHLFSMSIHILHLQKNRTFQFGDFRARQPVRVNTLPQYVFLSSSVFVLRHSSFCRVDS